MAMKFGSRIGRYVRDENFSVLPASLRARSYSSGSRSAAYVPQPLASAFSAVAQVTAFGYFSWRIYWANIFGFRERYVSGKAKQELQEILARLDREKEKSTYAFLEAVDRVNDQSEFTALKRQALALKAKICAWVDEMDTSELATPS